MKRLLLLLLLVACAAATTAGCAARGSEKYDEYRAVIDSWPYHKYVYITTRDLLLDAVDIADVQMSFGPGLLVNVQPTKLAQFGGGYEKVGKIGWRSRFAGFWTEERAEGGISMWYYRSMDFTPVFGTPSMWSFPPIIQEFIIRDNKDRHWLDIGADFNIIFGGFGFFFSPMNTVDFLANAIEYPYNIVLRRPLNYLNFRPPEFDFADDDTAAQVAREFGLTLIKPGVGFAPADWIDETFRSPY